MSNIQIRNLYYLGPDGSNAHYAALQFLKTSNLYILNKLPQKTIRSAIEHLVLDDSSICVLPIENSIEGIVRETIDNIQKIKDKNILIQGEITIPINHSLLANTMDKKKIKTIISHPQALAQCSDYLFQNFPNAQLKEVSSTSYAAQKISIDKSDDSAAIANMSCASIFNLNILEDNINDESDNKTRFYILGRQKLTNISNGKTAIIFATKNQPGSLCNILQILSKHNINLSYIDSRPSKKHLGEYLFFMELDGLISDNKIAVAINELLLNVEYFKNLGSFNIF